MENLASHGYDDKADNKVKEELEIAGIPVMKLPSYMNTEVKTKHIGLLNGFVFYRAWTYWVCEGLMPLAQANELYTEHKDLNIRAGGHCGNETPESQSVNPIYDKELDDFINQNKNSLGLEKCIAAAHDIIDDKTQPRFVNAYHIDTQLGLCKLAETIAKNNIADNQIGICRMAEIISKNKE